jgi:hypothetical protein
MMSALLIVRIIHTMEVKVQLATRYQVSGGKAERILPRRGVTRLRRCRAEKRRVFRHRAA